MYATPCTEALEIRRDDSRRTFVSKTSPMRTLSEPRAKILAKLSMVQNLDDDWDGSGSPRIDVGLFEQAFTIAMRVPEMLEPIMSIVPSPGGGLQFEWHRRMWTLELELLPDRTMEFLLVDRTGDRKTLEGPLRNEAIDAVFDSLHLLEASDQGK